MCFHSLISLSMLAHLPFPVVLYFKYMSILYFKYIEYMIKVAPHTNGKKMDYSINGDGQLGSHGEKKRWICISHCIYQDKLQRSQIEM